MKRFVLIYFVAALLPSNLAMDLNCPSGLRRCDWMAWSTWSSCSKTCGNGTQTRSRGLCCYQNETVVDCRTSCGISDQSIDSKGCGTVCPKGNCSFMRINNTSIEATDYKPLYEDLGNKTKIIINPSVHLSSSERFCGSICYQASLQSGHFCWAYSYSQREKCYLHFYDRPFSIAHPELRGQSKGTSIFLLQCTGYTGSTTTTAPVSSKGNLSTEAAYTGSTTTTTPVSSKDNLSTEAASCIAKVADVVFVVDSSGSIGSDNFQKVREFIKDVVMTFDVEPRYTRVALIEYSTVAHIEFKLHEMVNLTDLLKAIDNIAYSGGGTATSDALKLMRTEGFDRERPDAPDIAIVITDGLSKYPKITRTQANLAKSEGITVFSIGIGNLTDENELLAIASDKRFSFEVGDYEKLLTLESVVAHMACGVVLPEQNDTITTSTTPSVCVDLSPDCASYPRDSCTDFEPYARKNCARTCGYCPGFPLVDPPCKDKLDNCDHYGTYMCYDVAQYDWVDSNCRKYCGFCGNKTEFYISTTSSTTQAISTVSTCQDKFESCSSYNADLCTNPTYDTWARSNCPRYCGFCFNYNYVTSAVVNHIKCPSWNLPEQCTLEYKGGQCCPFPKCTDGLRLTIKRHFER
ncbi:matrilin-2-like [Mercenaria mercenaria]|uniref:matrilin-2-like n=1 Tax=Mercenaria mercenaria TaxID=6596 RepID=UPI00234F0960|nr:matrilin-2-like [Mercenaria mercenaria]